MQEDCVFCQISDGRLSAQIVYQDDEMTAFWDRHPAAPVHILIIPNKHIDSLNEAEEGDAALLGRLMLKAREIAEEQGVREKGYRLLLNVGKEGGQSVFHLHVHLFAGPHLMAIHG
ncbi:MAG: histidine triad nucleotide-binding protein [Pelolinea sp.]|nr:histidine triad nucleotide-binding protein [Pelolinea sp.]